MDDKSVEFEEENCNGKPCPPFPLASHDLKHSFSRVN